MQAHLPESDDDADIPYRAEVIRKLLHLLALIIPLGMWLIGREAAILVFLPLALVGVAADVLRARSYWVNRFIDRYFGFMMRGRERPPVGGPVVINGATWVAISAAMLSVLFPVHVGAAAFSAFILGDAAAALIGRRWGRRRWPGTTRTVEGSLAFLFVSLGILAGFGIFSTTGIVAASLIGAAAEALPGPTNDNIRVPLVMALALLLL
ncbi:MAG: diacylglycerol/polyprenol kinase family protein [Bacteroidota bacterium]